MNTKNTLSSLYSFHGFQALSTLKPHPMDTEGLVITLRRRQKKMFVPVVERRRAGIMTEEHIVSEIRQAVKHVSTLNLNTDGSIVQGATP